jgi:hypothetical protein
MLCAAEPRNFTSLDFLAAKRAGAEADTRALEVEIDRHVYALYGLTPAEIALVEAAAKERYSLSPTASSASSKVEHECLKGAPHEPRDHSV